MPPPAGAARRGSTSNSVRNRAVTLLETFFLNDTDAQRRAVVNAAFDGIAPDPRTRLEYPPSAAAFAAKTVDTLLAFGCALRGRHYLSLLIGRMAEIRGRQTDPGYTDLPPVLDAACRLPTRAEEQRHLEHLLAESEKLAKLYSPLQALAQLRPATSPAEAAGNLWQGNPHIALLRHQSRPQQENRQQAKPETRDFDDILTARQQVPRAALLGAPGSGKSTTLRKLAVDLALQAQQDSTAPLPLLAPLGVWTGDEPLAEFLAATAAPEIGWAVEALSREGRLVLLLDGLNEVPTAKHQAKAAQVAALRDRLPAHTEIIVS